VAGETVDSSQKQLAAALAKAEAAGAQVTLLQQRLRDKTATMVEGARREAKLKELLTDAQVFVDVSRAWGWVMVQDAAVPIAWVYVCGVRQPAGTNA
jgi:hypothetical protein